MTCFKHYYWHIMTTLSYDWRKLMLTHWGRVTHKCVDNLIIIGSDNGLSPGRRQAIIWTNAGILLIGPLGTNFSEILIEILTFSLKNAFESVVCEMAAILSRHQCVKLPVFVTDTYITAKYKCSHVRQTLSTGIGFNKDFFVIQAARYFMAHIRQRHLHNGDLARTHG